MEIVKRLNLGFTLVELMVVIVILGLLTGIAVPTYRDYVLRAKMLESVSVVKKLLDDAKQQYMQTQSMPASVAGIASGATGAYTRDPCIAFVHYNAGSSWTNAGRAVLVQGIVAPNCARGIQGYAAGIGGTHNRVSMAFIAEGEILKTYCGTWQNDGTEVPIEYLPEGCKDEAFMALVTGD